MPKPVTRICCDCGARLKNRSKSTKRCHACKVVYRRINAKGRVTGQCVECGARLSAKKNTTGRCRSCSLRDVTKFGNPFPARGKPWNKGQSIFKDEAARRASINARRKTRRQLLGLSSNDVLADRIRTLIRNSLRGVGTRK